ncbi:MAG: hypothetical protein ABSG16_05510 [Candidatus Acidiferrum sp.]|jgi:hypothetical protein
MIALKQISLAALAACALNLALSVAPGCAAQSKPLGLVLETQYGRIGGALTSEGSTIFPGDILTTDSDAALKVRIGQTTYELLGDTTVVFYAGQSSPIAELRRGTLTVSNSSPSEGFQIYASDVHIVSDQERPIRGQVSLKSPCELVVSSQEGLLDVIAGSEKKTVDHEHTYRVIPEHSVDDARQAISPEDPDYHKNHKHAGCAAPIAQHAVKGPIMAASSHFTELAYSATGVVVAISVIKALESPDRP